MRELNIQFSELMGPEWGDIWCNGKYLFLPGWRRGFDAGEVRSVFWKVQRLAQLEHQVQQLEKELDRRVLECEHAEDLAQFYRHQCQLESRWGLMLERLTT